jgi:signal transduction histidine kinase
VSVRSRFTTTVVAIVALTIVLFAVPAIVVLDRTLRSGLDSRLHSAAQAIAMTVDVHHGRISLDASDLHTIARLRADAPFAVYAADGSLLAGNPPKPEAANGLVDATSPIVHDDRSFGSARVWQSDTWIADFDRDAVVLSLAIGGLITALAAVLSGRVARKVLEPAARIASLAERIEAHDLSARLDTDATDELGRLCASFDRMLHRLQSAFERERRFVADASHELRAPLAVLRGEVDLALRRPRDVDEYRRAIESISTETQRLETLTDELLAAARSDLDARRREPLDAAALTAEIGERIRVAALERKICIVVNGSRPAFIDAHRATLERAMLAIAHNAIQHAPDGGTVRLHVRNGDGSVRVDVHDDGPGFSSEALLHATERFWRGDGGRKRDGTGLGLTIAQTLIAANGGELSLGNDASGGAVVTVAFRAASSPP